MDPDTFSDLAQSVLEWAELRNAVVHQMVKVGPTYTASWTQRLAQARKAAQAGVELHAAVTRVVAAYEHRGGAPLS